MQSPARPLSEPLLQARQGHLAACGPAAAEIGLTGMFITHDLATAGYIADKAVILEKGRVVEQGPKDKTFTPPHPDYAGTLPS